MHNADKQYDDTPPTPVYEGWREQRNVDRGKPEPYTLQPETKTPTTYMQTLGLNLENPKAGNKNGSWAKKKKTQKEKTKHAPGTRHKQKTGSLDTKRKRKTKETQNEN